MSQLPPQPPDYPYQPGQYPQQPITQPPLSPAQRQRKPRRWAWIIALIIGWWRWLSRSRVKPLASDMGM